MGGVSDQQVVSLLDVYTPALNTWKSLKSMVSDRRSFGVASLGGSIIVAGGISSEGESLSAVERYDPQTDTWTSLSNMNTSRYCHSLVTFRDRCMPLGVCVL